MSGEPAYLVCSECGSVFEVSAAAADFVAMLSRIFGGSEEAGSSVCPGCTERLDREAKPCAE